MLPYSRKDPLPFPFFEAVTALRFSPDYLTRERQEFKEEGHSFNPRTAREQCLAAYGQTAGVPSFLPTAVGTASSPSPPRGAAPFPPSADGESPPLNLSEKHPAR